jgi:hypothetical protein
MKFCNPILSPVRTKIFPKCHKIFLKKRRPSGLTYKSAHIFQQIGPLHSDFPFCHKQSTLMTKNQPKVRNPNKVGAIFTLVQARSTIFFLHNTDLQFHALPPGIIFSKFIKKLQR